MTTIVLYGGEGAFAEGGAYEWEGPEAGSTRRFILFLAQDDAVSHEELALGELKRYGFHDARIVAGKPIAVEALNTPSMQAFRRHYEGAIEEGSSIVWYP